MGWAAVPGQGACSAGLGADTAGGCKICGGFNRRPTQNSVTGSMENVAECKADCAQWNRRGAPETVEGAAEAAVEGAVEGAEGAVEGAVEMSIPTAPHPAEGRAVDPAPAAESTGGGVANARELAESVRGTPVCQGPEAFHVNPTDESRALALRVFAAVCRLRKLAKAEAARQCVKIDRVSAIEGEFKVRVVSYYGKRVHVYLTLGARNAHQVRGPRTGSEIRRFLNLPDNRSTVRHFEE